MNDPLGFKTADLTSIAPMLFLFLGSLLPIAYKTFLRKNNEPPTIVAFSLAFLGILASLATVGLFYAEQTKAYYAFSNALVIDGVSSFSMVLIAIITACVALMAREHKATNGVHFSEFLFLLLNSAMGMMILVCANDLIVMFVAIEVMSLSLYLIIALSREEVLSKEAAFKYFVLGSFASAIFLYGVAFIYGVVGSTYLTSIASLSTSLMVNNKLFMVGFILTVIGFSFKAALVPFHGWSPDVYQGAPTPITAFMASGVKLVTFVAFLRFLQKFDLTAATSFRLIDILQWLAVLTMVIGNIAAITQNNLKRMLAYSSIAHSGYVFVGIIAASIGGESVRGNIAVLYYVASYALTTLGAFGVVCLFEKHEGDIISVDDLKGLGHKQPLLAFVFTILLLSLAGIPPLIGFFGKFFIFTAAVNQGLYWLAIWGAISSIISVFYYLRPIVNMYMKEESSNAIVPLKNLTLSLSIVIATLVIVLGVATEPIYERIKTVTYSFLKNP